MFDEPHRSRALQQVLTPASQREKRGIQKTLGLSVGWLEGNGVGGGEGDGDGRAVGLLEGRLDGAGDGAGVGYDGENEGSVDGWRVPSISSCRIEYIVLPPSLV